MVQIVPKLEPTEMFYRDCKITRFSLARQLFIYFGAPGLPINMITAYHRFNGERSMHMSRKVCVCKGVWLERPGKFEK